MSINTHVLAFVLENVHRLDAQGRAQKNASKSWRSFIFAASISRPSFQEVLSTQATALFAHLKGPT